jgi:hypothetical protein
MLFTPGTRKKQIKEIILGPNCLVQSSWVPSSPSSVNLGKVRQEWSKTDVLKEENRLKERGEEKKHHRLSVKAGVCKYILLFYYGRPLRHPSPYPRGPMHGEWQLQ